MRIEIIGEFPAVAAHGLGIDIAPELLAPYLVRALGCHAEGLHNHIARLAESHLFARVVPRRHRKAFGIKHQSVHIENSSFYFHRDTSGQIFFGFGL